MIARRCSHLAADTRALLLGVSLLFLFAAPPAAAWNAAGHRLVAAIAWEQLTEPEKAAIALLLRAHPDYTRWVRRTGDSNADRTAFIEASTWADEIRHDPRFYDAGTDAPTPVLVGFPDMQRHRDWHYVNRRLDDVNVENAEKAVSGRIGEQLIALPKMLASAASSRSRRAYDLPWIIHLVADAHQPLHVGARFENTGKRAGQYETPAGVGRVINPYNPRKRNSTLHAFWDDLPGPPWLRGKKLEVATRSLLASYPPPPQSPPRQWLEESWRIARVSGYPEANGDDVVVISARFQQAAVEIAQRRIAEAGYRLAALLRASLSAKQAGKQAGKQG